VGFVCDLNSANLKFICRTGFAGRAARTDYPLANRFDEVDALVIFDNVLIPWENVLFYRHTRAASYIRATLHRYSAFAFVQRNLRLADLMIGAALFNARQTGLDKQQAVQEKLAQLAVYREGINAHLTAAASFEAPETKPWLEKYYSVNENWVAEDRRRLLAFARDLLNSDYAGHRLTFQLFAQSPPFAHLAAVYRSFDWDAPLRLVQQSAQLSERVLAKPSRTN